MINICTYHKAEHGNLVIPCDFGPELKGVVKAQETFMVDEGVEGAERARVDEKTHC